MEKKEEFQPRTSLKILGSNRLDEVSFTTGLFRACNILNVHGDFSKLSDHGIIVFFTEHLSGLVWYM